MRCATRTLRQILRAPVLHPAAAAALGPRPPGYSRARSAPEHGWPLQQEGCSQTNGQAQLSLLLLDYGLLARLLLLLLLLLLWCPVVALLDVY
jgi:hypothetical protein